jgi:hypothetical protein
MLERTFASARRRQSLKPSRSALLRQHDRVLATIRVSECFRSTVAQLTNPARKEPDILVHTQKGSAQAWAGVSWQDNSTYGHVGAEWNKVLQKVAFAFTGGALMGGVVSDPLPRRWSAFPLYGCCSSRYWKTKVNQPPSFRLRLTRCRQPAGLDQRRTFIQPLSKPLWSPTWPRCPTRLAPTSPSGVIVSPRATPLPRPAATTLTQPAFQAAARLNVRPDPPRRIPRTCKWRLVRTDAP